MPAFIDRGPTRAEHAAGAPLARTEASNPPLYILTTSCPDTTGIVAAIAGFLAQEVERVDHTQSAADLAVVGSELETVVLK